MGQQVLRQRLIVDAELDGNKVHATIADDDDFTLALLYQHLQLEYPKAIILNTYHPSLGSWRCVALIRFDSTEDAIRFCLSS